MKFTLKFFSGLLLVAFALAITTQSCKKDEDKEAPTIPPVGSFVISAADFGDKNDTIQKSTTDVMSYNNWGQSYIRVVFWELFKGLHMIVPVASFVESFNHEAVYHPDDEYWTWSYNFNAAGNHQAELTGSLENDSVVWEMRIDDFLWYHGKSHYQGTGGYWILNKNKTNPVELLRIEWNKNSDGTSDIKYLNIEPNAPANGGYLYYGITNGEYDRFYDIRFKDANNDNLTNIEWNSIDKHGRIKADHIYNDNAEFWHCWDTSLQDTDCE